MPRVRRHRTRTQAARALPGRWRYALPVGAFSLMLTGAALALLAPDLARNRQAAASVETGSAPSEAPVVAAVVMPIPRPDRPSAGDAEPASVTAEEKKDDPFLGNWRGTGWIARSSGMREELNCRASHVVRDKDDSTLHVLRCANERFQIDLTSGLSDKNGKISGWWREAAHDRKGGLSGRRNGDKLSLYLRGENLTASLHATVKGCRQSIGIKIVEGGEREGHVSLRKVGC